MSPLTVLLKNRLRLIRNWHRVLRRQSRFKTGFILLFGAGLLVALQFFFARGFRMLDGLGQAGVMILPRLFAMFFLAMALMLIVSGAITAYTTLFRSSELRFLMVHPVPAGAMTVYKAVESAGLASWAFLFIIVPFTLAYARHQALTPWITLWTLVMAVPFLLLCAGIGTLLTLAITRLTARSKVRKYILGIALGAMLVAAWFGWRPQRVDDESLFMLAQLVPGFRLASNPLLPPAWMAEGILSFSRGEWMRGFLFWSILASYAVITAILIEWPGGRWFRIVWQRAATPTARRRRRGPIASGRFWQRLPLGFAPAVRAMIVKDIRTFLRDPAQWSQGLIFFGLLALYFANLRTLRYHYLPPTWRAAIAFLNMFSLATVMCSLSSRFIFPQLSLEGQAFWLLGLAPVSRGRILLAKMATALTANLAVSVGLMTISSRMLNVAAPIHRIAIGVGAMSACAFTGLSVGLGAVFMDLRQSNPAAIVSGFGGTLNLVLSLGFMLAAILPFVIVEQFQPVLRAELGWEHPLAIAWVWLILLTFIAVALPLHLGYRALRVREY